MRAHFLPTPGPHRNDGTYGPPLWPAAPASKSPPCCGPLVPLRWVPGLGATSSLRQRSEGPTLNLINQRGTTIVPLVVKTLDDGDAYLRALDPDYADPGPDEVQQFAN